jgi:hypothetical protein
MIRILTWVLYVWSGTLPDRPYLGTQERAGRTPPSARGPSSCAVARRARGHHYRGGGTMGTLRLFLERPALLFHYYVMPHVLVLLLASRLRTSGRRCLQ